SFQLWENIKAVLSANGGIFPRWALNSVLYAGVGSVLATYFAVAAGYALAKYRFPGRRFIYVLVLGGVLVPGTAVALPLFFLFSSIGITNTYWSVLIPSLVSPFGLFLASIYASAAVPDEMLEAGRIDGVGAGPVPPPRAAAAHAGDRHRGAVPVRRDLEQLHAPARDAGRREALSDHPGPGQLAGPAGPAAGVLPAADRRRAAVGDPAGDPHPGAAALLARRAHGGLRQGLIRADSAGAAGAAAPVGLARSAGWARLVGYGR